MKGARPIGTAAGRPPGTATRLTTGMTNGGRVNLKTPAAGLLMKTQPSGGAGVMLASQVTVADRPITQQGLSGMKTAAGKAGKRQVQDKTYYLGQLRSKITELNAEIGKLRREIDEGEEENNSFLQYEKTAEVLANELKSLQGELGDYNTLVDKLNTDEDIQDVQMDLEELKAQNERDAKNIDHLFGQKQEKENVILQLERELDQERRMADNLVTNMNPEMRQRYMNLKDMNVHLLRQLESGQQELDALNTKKDNLEEELSMSQIKQEAVRLYDQLYELEMKRDQLIDEASSKGSPAEEREKLLKQVKEDNQEIASMERQANDIREKLAAVQEEIRQLDMDIEESQGERNQKYRELKKREETMNEFLDAFDETRHQEMQRISNLEANIVALLEHMSRNMARVTHLPTPKELQSMKEDLAFKEGEMKKSEVTATGLAGESEKLQVDLQKVEQLESKINSELDSLRSKIETMETELEVYSDIDRLKKEAEMKKKKLSEDKIILQKRRDTFKKQMQQLTTQYEALKAQLSENETYTQLGNLERKWHHHEQNNFVMKEFIATKTMECDYRPSTKRVGNMLEEYNKVLQEQLSGKPSV
ncbi:intraflagellar transport protein 74 homolog isoform X1 [Lineus longissimus]|uniref:intraflagellar transport protein 74 homolog isoform X1 n=1 Tax=Lineus longissimus TaxID=88925 RepID=UPI002B4F68AC